MVQLLIKALLFGLVVFGAMAVYTKVGAKV